MLEHMEKIPEHYYGNRNVYFGPTNSMIVQQHIDGLAGAIRSQ
jgi:hypothetical protein